MRERPAILYLDMVPGEPIQEMKFLEATEGTKADVISYSGTMGFGFFTALRTGADVNTNRFAGADEPWRNAVNEFAAMGLDAWLRAGAYERTGYRWGLGMPAWLKIATSSPCGKVLLP